MSAEIIVGCGTSALTHLYHALKSGFTESGLDCVVIGKDDLWNKISKRDPEHRFGQPPQIVHLQGKQETKDIDAKNPSGFQRADEIARQLKAMKGELVAQGVTFLDDEVTRVERVGQTVRVQTRKSGHLYGDRVIVATGFGRSALPKTPVPETIKAALSGRGSWQQSFYDWRNCIIGGTEYLYSAKVKAPSTGAFRVAVQGASATSAWAVLKAMSLRNEGQEMALTWITRSNFSQANPAGRNSDVLKMATENGWLVKASVDRIYVPGTAVKSLELTLGPVERVDRDRPPQLTTLGEAYKKYYQTNKSAPAAQRETGLGLRVREVTKRETVYVNHFVYALGADPALPGGTGAVLSEGLKQELEPVFDTGHRFDDDETATTLAFKTRNGDVWVVGAAVFRDGGIKNLRGKGGGFANIAQMMCEAGSPPEGIATIIAASKAVTGYYETALDKINLHTADFKEIERWFGEFYRRRTDRDASERTKRAMADQIVAMRKHGVFGLSETEIKNLGDPSNEFWDDVFVEIEGGPYMVDVMARAAA